MLSMKWSLKELYESFHCETLKNDLKKVNEYIDKFKKWAKEELDSNENGKEKIEFYIKNIEEYRGVLGRLASFASLTKAADSSNDDARKLEGILDKKSTELTEVFVAFEKWIGGLDDLESIINESHLLKEHKFYILEIKSGTKYALSNDVEVAIKNMKLTGSNAWENLRNQLTATHMVDINIDGEEQSLGINKVKNMLFSGNKEVRKKAFEAEQKSNKKIEIGVAAALNGIKGEVLTECKMRGYNSPLERTLIDSRMDEETLNAMMDAIKESLPMFKKYFLKKAQLLGYEGALPYYDIMAPISASEKEYSYEEARDFIVKHFTSFSEEMGALANRAFEEEWIDAESREGKRGGAFCSNLHVIGQSRILCSYSGSFKNVCTLAHELGHAYHGNVLTKETKLNSRYPMPLAETASIFCENIVRNAAIKEGDKEDVKAILGAELVNCSQVIVDIYARFLFEKEIFRRREEGTLSVDEIKEVMIWAQKEAYGDAIDEKTLDPYAWIHKPHYYFTSRNFYNFPYAFGLLFSKGLYSQYMKEGSSFVDKYNKILALTGKASIYDVTKFAGIDIHDINFWRSSLDMVKKDIEQFMEL